VSSEAEKPPHSPHAPETTTLPGLKELLARLRERFGVKVGARTTVGFKVPVEVHIAYKTLEEEEKRIIRESLELTIAATSLGLLNLRASPTLVVRKEVAPTTIAIEEAPVSELEARIRHLERELGICRDELELCSRSLRVLEKKLRVCEDALAEERARPVQPELERRYREVVELLNAAIHLIYLVYQPSVEDFVRDSTKRRRFAEGARAFLDRVMAFKESLRERGE